MRLVIAPEKLTDYLLNIQNVDGKAKANFFLARGFDRDRPDLLAQALLSHPLTAMLMKRSPHQYGYKLVYECAIQAADGSRPCIRSVWIEAPGGLSCHLVSAYPFG